MKNYFIIFVAIVASLAIFSSCNNTDADEPDYDAIRAQLTPLNDAQNNITPYTRKELQDMVVSTAISYSHSA